MHFSIYTKCLCSFGCVILSNWYITEWHLTLWDMLFWILRYMMVFVEISYDVDFNNYSLRRYNYSKVVLYGTSIVLTRDTHNKENWSKNMFDWMLTLYVLMEGWKWLCNVSEIVLGFVWCNWLEMYVMRFVWRK